MRHSRILRLATLASSLMILSTFVYGFSVAHATQANWQTAFSGTFNSQRLGADGGTAGFWGWCSFSGGTGEPATSGTDANCEVSVYMHAETGNQQLHMKITGTAWDQELSHMPPPPGSGLTPNDFFITAGSMTITGPSAADIIDIAAPQLSAAGCTVSGQTVACSIAIWSVVPPGCTPGVSCLYNPDTGIPAAPGHYSIDQIADIVGIPLVPASHINIQVNQLP